MELGKRAYSFAAKQPYGLLSRYLRSGPNVTAIASEIPLRGAVEATAHGGDRLCSMEFMANRLCLLQDSRSRIRSSAVAEDSSGATPHVHPSGTAFAKATTSGLLHRSLDVSLMKIPFKSFMQGAASSIAA